MRYIISPWNLRKVPGHARDSPGIIPGHSHENVVYVFCCLLVSSGPEMCKLGAL